MVVINWLFKDTFLLAPKCWGQHCWCHLNPDFLKIPRKTKDCFSSKKWYQPLDDKLCRVIFCRKQRLTQKSCAKCKGPFRCVTSRDFFSANQYWNGRCTAQYVYCIARRRAFRHFARFKVQCNRWHFDVLNMSNCVVWNEARVMQSNNAL